MNIINAKQAKEISDNKRQENVHSILVDIRHVAYKGEYELYVMKKLDNIVLVSLEKLGYLVGNLPSVAQQKGQGYHVISWKDV